MKKMKMAFVAAISMSVLFVSCQKDVKTTKTEVSQEELNQIAAMGFSTDGVMIESDGFIVEGDIFIPRADLGKVSTSPNLVVASEEQYRTTNLVTGLPRTITVQVSSSLPAAYVTNTDAAIARYNALGLTLTFQRVSSGGDIVISPAPAGAGYLASAGFPTSAGNPHNSILVNRSYMDTWNTNTVVSILAHEMGHCIGFRHTDYMNRQYSCGGRRYNEGASTVGAIHIPGTPTTADPNSWMLACIGNGVNRPFNANDVIALGYLY
ncbi:M57 family metalloprotease [Lacibacter sediminis]|uniref:Protease n=1 Tax=Lacibacter sediminis TaxID=2760713 RepID=A0A7G5XCM8_9BACT|nr:M57 family metalloprotease [Lacibacter sediminis]QNA43231.1 protease [Lacibacter sediminis]